MKSTTASSAFPEMRCGWTYPSRPSVVSGESRPAGSDIDELGRELDRVHELSLRGARMHRQPADRHPHRLRREGLDLELAEPGAVERVGDVGAERVEIEVLGSPADLLVDRERDPRGCPRSLGMPDEVRDRSHDLRDPGLVVGAEERRPVARDDVVPDPPGELGQLGRIENLPRVAGQRDRLAVPRAMHDRRHVGPDHVGRRVDVGDQTDRRRAFRSREAREDRGARVQARVGETELAELVDEQAREIELLLGARPLRDAIRTLRVDPDVAQEALEDVVGELGREPALDPRV